MAEYWQTKLQQMHRRAQKAEGALERVEEWLRYHEGEDGRQTHFVSRGMAIYYLKKIRAAVDRAHPNTQTEQERP